MQLLIELHDSGWLERASFNFSLYVFHSVSDPRGCFHGRHYIRLLGAHRPSSATSVCKQRRRKLFTFERNMLGFQVEVGEVSPSQQQQQQPPAPSSVPSSSPGEESTAISQSPLLPSALLADVLRAKLLILEMTFIDDLVSVRTGLTLFFLFRIATSCRCRTHLTMSTGGRGEGQGPPTYCRLRR